MPINPNVQVSDTIDDAIKNKTPPIKNPFLNSLVNAEFLMQNA